MKKLLLSGWLALVALAPALAQPSNDEPVAADPLTYDPTCANPVPGRLTDATVTAPNGYPAVGCAGALAGDVWYRFFAPASGPASTGFAVSVVGAAAHEIRVFSTILGSAGPFVEVACTAGAAGAAAPTAFVTATPSTPYYIKIGQRAGGSGPAPFVVCVGVAPACGDPRNVAISSLGGTSATVSYGAGINNTSYLLTLTPTAGGPPQTFTTLYTSYDFTGLTPLTAYTLTVQGICAAGGTGSVITRTFTTTIDNDDPNGAIPLPVTPLGAVCTPLRGTTVGATPGSVRGVYNPRFRANNCDNDLSGLIDVWYRIPSVPSGTTWEITVTGAAANTLRVFSYNGITYDSDACSTPQGTTPISLAGPPFGSGATTAQPLRFTGSAFNGQFGYVAVGTAVTAPGPFTICLREVADNPCNDFLFPNLGILNVTSIGSQVATLTYTLPLGANFRLTATPVSGGAPLLFNNITLPYTLTGLQPATRYQLELVRLCPGGGVSSPRSIGFNTAYPGPPSNDNCANAQPLVCGQYVQGRASASTNETGDPPLCGGFAGIMRTQVWYTFVGQGVPMTVNYCDAATLTAPLLAVYTGTCGALQCVPNQQLVSSSTGCATSPLIGGVVGTTVATTAGTVYYLGVYNNAPFNAGGDAGNFGLTLTRTTGACAAPCQPPTALVAGALTGTTASIGFTAPAGGAASSYTATATPVTGGPPVTASGPAAPLLLLGLAPNTAYTVSVASNCPPTASAASASLAIRTPLAGREAALAALVGLFPNPAHHAATLTLPAEASRAAGTVRLLDGLGRSVRTLPLPAGTTRLALDLAGLPPGLYTVQVLAGPLALAKRLLVE